MSALLPPGPNCRNASNKTSKTSYIHAYVLNTEPRREHGAPLLALIHFKMQMGGFEIQPVCVMLGYFNVVSMLGIILSTAGWGEAGGC